MVETYLREGACCIDEPSGCRSFVLTISSLMDSERVISNQLDVVSAPAGSDQQDSDGSDSDEVGSDECGSDDGSSSLASWRSMTESVSGVAFLAVTATAVASQVPITLVRTGAAIGSLVGPLAVWVKGAVVRRAAATDAFCQAVPRSE